MYRMEMVLKTAVLIGAFAVFSCGGGSSPREAGAQPEQSAGASGQETVLAQAGDAQQAPGFTLKTLAGETVSLESFKGKVLIVDFWATWCPPCVKEIPHFVELYNTYKDQGLEILGVSVDREGPSVVERFIQKNSVSYTIAMANMDVVDAYEIYSGIPTTFIIGRDGKVVQKIIGYQDKIFFEKHIKELL